MRFYACILMILLSVSCNKNSNDDCTSVSSASEAPALMAFCTTNNINYTVDSNSIYYEILDPGSGEMVTDNSLITVTYTASFLDGTVFASQDEPVSDYLRSFIEGWRIAIPYIKKGGHIKMAIPSNLCYGCSGCCSAQPGAIAPNTPLYYDVVLKDVQN